MPELLRKVNQVAKDENRTRSELFREALRRYVEEKEWQQLQRYGHLIAQEKGLKEEDVNRLLDEYRSGNINA